jgi:hypothetical protein
MLNKKTTKAYVYYQDSIFFREYHHLAYDQSFKREKEINPKAGN